MTEKVFREIMKQVRVAVHNVREKACEQARMRDSFLQATVYKCDAAARAVRNAGDMLGKCEGQLVREEQRVRNVYVREFVSPLEQLTRIRTKAVRDASVLPSKGVAAMVSGSAGEVYREALAKAWALVRELEAKHNAEVE